MSRRVATIKDVAKAAEVSIGTVSAVIHGKGSVNSEMRIRVEAAIAGLGYTPNAVAQSMRFGSTRTIGVLVAHLNAPGMTDFISAAQNVLDEAGYAMLLAPYSGSRDRELSLIEILRRRKVDGLLIYPQSEQDVTLDEALLAVNVPVVVVDRESERWDTVVVGHRRAIQRATEHLLQLGHRRIAFMAGNRSIYPSRERLLGYEAAHEAYGVAIDPTLIRSQDYLADYGFRETSALARQRDGATAIIAGGMLLTGVLRALNVNSLNVPGDMSVVCASDSDLTELLTPSITSERWDGAEVGTITAGMLLEQLRSPTPLPPRRSVVPAQLIFRDSCAPPKS